MVKKVTKDGGFLFIDEALIDLFVGNGWETEDNTSETPQNDDTEVETEKTTISLSKDKKRLKSRFEK